MQRVINLRGGKSKIVAKYDKIIVEKHRST